VERGCRGGLNIAHVKEKSFPRKKTHTHERTFGTAQRRVSPRTRPMESGSEPVYHEPSEGGTGDKMTAFKKDGRKKRKKSEYSDQEVLDFKKAGQIAPRKGLGLENGCLGSEGGGENSEGVNKLDLTKKSRKREGRKLWMMGGVGNRTLDRREDSNSETANFPKYLRTHRGGKEGKRCTRLSSEI